MKITSVELHPAGSSDVCVLSFRDPKRQNPFNVKGIDGLDADDVVARYYGGSGGSSKFYNFYLEERNIVISISLNPNFSSVNDTYSSLRDRIYKLIASSRTGSVQVQFKNGTNVIAAVSGLVTKLEAPHFEKSPEVKVTIKCDDPMLRALAATAVDVTGLDPAATTITDDLSTAPHGFSFELEFIGPLASLVISDPNDANWAFEVTPTGGFLAGDTLYFSSEYNAKELYVVRGASTIYLGDAIVPGSVWPILFPGANVLSIDNATSVIWNAISYTPTYWGGVALDIFRFKSPTSPTLLEQGEIVNGLKSKMWIERYRTAGEFKFVADASTKMREKLPIGSIISHVDTTEIMIVENHEINERKGSEAEITITGRGFESFFDNRIVGSNKTFPTSGTITDYILAADYTWNQAVNLLTQHLLASALVDDNDALPYVDILSTVTGTGESIQRSLKRGSLYTRLMELLAVDNLGIKVVRPGPWSANAPDIAVTVHKGVDRTSSVIFSYDTGEIESADYLWSNKKLKNTAYVIGKWVETLVTTAQTEYNRRMMYVEASDIDQAYSAAPTGTDLDNVVAAMQQRGNEALASQINIALTKAEVSRNATKALYRTDFDVGDLITINGDYNEVSTMRISEYVEIEDRTGKVGYPTLTVDP